MAKHFMVWTSEDDHMIVHAERMFIMNGRLQFVEDEEGRIDYMVVAVFNRDGWSQAMLLPDYPTGDPEDEHDPMAPLTDVDTPPAPSED